MADKPTTKQGQIAHHLHEREVSDKQVVVHPDDDDLFVVAGKNLIRSCRLQSSIELWLKELELAKNYIRSWCQVRRDKVIAAYLVPRPTRLSLFLVQQSDAYDFDLSDDVTDLDLDLNKDYNLGNVEPFQIPAAEVLRFVDLQQADQLHG